MRAILATFSASLFAMSPIVMADDLTDLYQNSVSRQPYVYFSARSGVLGHSFVVVGEELDNGLLFNLGVYGFYPKDGKKVAIKALFGTDGVINYKWADLEADIRFRKNISGAEKADVLRIMEKWASGDKEYSLLGNNCNALAKEVAVALRMTVPDTSPGTTLPPNYTAALKSANNF